MWWEHVASLFGEYQKVEGGASEGIRTLDLRFTHRLNPPEDDVPGSQEPEVIRIVCSDGIL